MCAQSFWTILSFCWLFSAAFFGNSLAATDTEGRPHPLAPENFCDCGMMDSPTSTDPLMIHHFHTGYNQCDVRAELSCRNLCVAFFEAGRTTGTGKTILCKFYNKDLNARINIFSRVCNAPFQHSGIEYIDPVCCKDGKVVEECPIK